MKTFVTGGTGFIGTRVVRRLIQRGHEPHCLVRTTSDTAELERMAATLVTGDVTDRASVLEGMSGCDWVVNLANVYSWWEPDKRVYRTVNVEGTRNVMECALETDMAKVVHVSTAYVYGKPATSPFTEETPVGPVRRSAYTRTKYAGDLIAWQLHGERGLPLVMLYPGTVLGAGDPKLTGRYLRRFLSGSVPRIAFTEAVHTYVHVRDVAEAIVLALEKEDNIGEKYLVGKYQLSIKAFNALISEISGAALPPTAPGPVTLLTSTLATWRADVTKEHPRLAPVDYFRVIRDGCAFDGSKAEEELGLTYTPIRDTLTEAIDALR
jgi:dihydroflavonol-4-reductase